MSIEIQVDIKPLQEDEILLLGQAVRREPFTHYERYLSQQAGILVYLVAWQDGMPVGIVMVRWKGKSLPALERCYPGCPHLMDLYVVPAYRNCHVGTRLMEAAEQAARGHGCAHIGLSVALENHRARVLYERRRYIDVGLDTFIISYNEIDEWGNAHPVEDECVYLVREL